MIYDGKIGILDSINIDWNLPKHKKETSYLTSNTPSGFEGNSDGGSVFVPSSELIAISSQNKIGLLHKLFGKFKKKQVKQEPVPSENLSEFFSKVKMTTSELDVAVIDDILGKYETVVGNARNNNQVALVEKIEDYVKVMKYEAVLAASKFNKYVSEEDIVKFHELASVHEKYNTGLMLTYIKNFVKIIPDDVTKLKMEADALKVFDNYVILHYDPSGKSVEKTKKEKDLILFGVIQDSRKLYYIGDWIDEYCDLTLDKLISTIGKESVDKITVDNIVNDLSKI